MTVSEKVRNLLKNLCITNLDAVRMTGHSSAERRMRSMNLYKYPLQTSSGAIYYLFASSRTKFKFEKREDTVYLIWKNGAENTGYRTIKEAKSKIKGGIGE